MLGHPEELAQSGRMPGNVTVKGFITFAASKLLFLRLAFSAAKLMKPLTVTEAAPISSRVNLWSL